MFSESTVRFLWLLQVTSPVIGATVSTPAEKKVGSIALVRRAQEGARIMSIESRGTVVDHTDNAASFAEVELHSANRTAFDRGRAAGSNITKPRGVFVIKVHEAREASRTLCTLTQMFNGKARYQVRIFADKGADHDEAYLQSIGGGQVRVIVDNISWRELPKTLTEVERQDILKTCRKEKTTWSRETTCSSGDTPIGYIYMGYWRYAKMALEPALSNFDYFISLDADAYLTKPISVDPFALMQENGLKGLYNILAMQYGDIARGVQDAIDASFPLRERRARSLGTASWSDEDGKWGGGGCGRQPAVWGCFFGGQLALLRSSRFQELARRMAYSTYRYRADEQGVIAAGWALLAHQSEVWYLPRKGVSLGVYHHGWIDNCAVQNLGQMTRTCLGDTWCGFDEPSESLVEWRTYVETTGQRMLAETCASLPTKR